MILGIDPSFTSTGVALLDDELNFIDGISFGYPGGNTKIPTIHEHSNAIVDRCLDFIKDVDLSQLDVVIEVPAFSSISGGYLAILNGFLGHTFEHLPIRSLMFLPPTACYHYIKTPDRNKKKQYLVSYCYDKEWVTKSIKLDHDILSCVVFAHILKDIWSGTYKNVYYECIPKAVVE